MVGTNSRSYQFRIERATGDGKKQTATYKVPADSISTVLDGLIFIKEHIDSSLSMRYSCTMEICGSCAMVINGRPRMACSTIASSLGSPTINVAPMRNYPVVRDLVVDMESFFAKHRSVKPYIVREDILPYTSELLQTPEDFEKYERYSMCIKCGLCLAACPASATDPNYLGPSALTSVLRYNLDSRDEDGHSRIEIIDDENGLPRCHFAGECTEVCPKDVEPSFAIQILRRQSLKHEIGQIFRRNIDERV